MNRPLLIKISIFSNKIITNRQDAHKIYFVCILKMFNKPSPKNHRPDVDDVVLLFTDGEPVRRTSQQWKPRPEDKFGFKSEKAMADFYSTKLKNNGVTVVGLAAGSQSQLDIFYDDIKGWTTSDKLMFRADLSNLDNVLSKLVKASCVGPGKSL